MDDNLYKIYDIKQSVQFLYKILNDIKNNKKIAIGFNSKEKMYDIK